MGEREVDRRGFLKGAVGAGAVVALAATGCTSKADADGPAWDHEVDVAVAGFGIGGVTASLAAQQAGAKVLALESYTQIGGTAVDSAGGVMGQASMDKALETMPYGDSKLLQPFVDAMPKVTEMIKKTGAAIRPSGVGFFIGAKDAHDSRQESFKAMEKAFKDAGGTLLMETKAIKLLTSADGTISGLQARAKDGKILNIKAKAVILACGGFQNNAEMKTKFFGPNGDQAVARSVPTNDGTGIMMAQAIGAGLSKSLGGFYGHSIASNIDANFMDFSYISSQYHDNRCIVVNLDGVRFSDEGAGVAGDLCNQALMGQRFGRGCLIFDQYIYDKWGSTTAGGANTGIDRTKEVQKRGGRVVSANTIEELAQKMAAWGYNRASVIKTVKDYNAAVDANTTADLPVPRTAGIIASIVKIAQPPFWATEVVPGVSCCYGGLAINPKGEVLKAESKDPILGLYAIPGCAGGITYGHYYSSSQGASAAYGWVSAQNAVTYAKSK